MIGRGFGRIGRPGLLGTMARTAVVAGTATAVSGGMIRHQRSRDEERQEAAAYEQYQAAQQAAPQQAAPQQPQPDLIEQLNQLGDLKERGVLTEAEFEAQKAKLLAG